MLLIGKMEYHKRTLSLEDDTNLKVLVFNPDCHLKLKVLFVLSFLSDLSLTYGIDFMYLDFGVRDG